LQSGRFQLPNAANSMENRHGQESRKNWTETNSVLKQFPTHIKYRLN
jgi:hypothetical protein